MTENRDEINNGNGPDIKTRYEFLIAGLVVVVLCIVAFVTFRITSYINGAQVTDNTVSTLDMSDGTLLIEVEIKDSESDPSGDASDPSASDSDDAQATLNEHDDIEVFITAKEGDDFYKSKEGRLKLYVEPKETDDDRPALVETVPFRVLGFSRDGWAAIVFGGTRYYVKSSDIVKTDVPDDAPEYVAPEDSQGIRFFAPVEGDGEEYVATMNTVAFSLPDVRSSGNKVNLKEGEVVKVVAVGGDWYKIDYMNAEYYVLSYLMPKDAYAD